MSEQEKKCPPFDLELVETDDLINELRKRHTVFVMIGRPLAKMSYDWRFHWGGLPHEVIGMMEVCKNDLLNGKGKQ